GLAALTDRTIGRRVTTGLIALFVAVDIGAMFFIPRPIEYRAAGLALRGQIPANAPVLMRKRQIAFYSNTAYEWIPFSDVQGVLDYGQTKGADYFMIDSATTLATRPQLVYLLDETNAPSLIRVFYKTGGDTDKVIVYQIVK
ncbi:MAG TPA: hypothetical protein VFF70_08380, partial [Anaerolineae bacterium]|nr:hypothetical protein [Anaerolineae bacterium]